MAAATTTRRAGALLCALLALAVPAAEAAQEEGVIPAPAPARLAPSPGVAARRWLVELGGAAVGPSSLRETGHDTPAPETESEVGVPWERDWEETGVWLSLSREFSGDERRSLRIGLRVGAAYGRFSAGNEGLSFSESWKIRPAVSWGASAAGEIRRSPRSGPFLRGRLDYRRAQAGEDSESVQSGRAEMTGSHRDAEFAWHQTDLSVGLGWRRGALAALAGVDYRRFVLHKRLTYHIPLPEVPELAGAGFDLVQKLNSRESTYDYRNRHPWAPRLGLEWRVADAWLVAADCALPVSTGCGLAVRLGF